MAQVITTRSTAACDTGRVGAPAAAVLQSVTDTSLTPENPLGGGGSSEPALRVAGGCLAAPRSGRLRARVSAPHHSTTRYRRSPMQGRMPGLQSVGMRAGAEGAVSASSAPGILKACKEDLATLPWLVLQVTPGREDVAARRVRAVAGDTACDCFALRRQTFFRERGVWGLRETLAYPGYLFAVVRDEDAFLDALSLIATDGIRLITSGPKGAGAPARLAVREARLIRELAGEIHVIEASVGRIVEGQLVVDRGPIRGREDLVTRIDRHRRSAWLDMGLLGSRSVSVALEVVSKT